ncbi:MAG: TylF/MycF family methyltransferase [Candidatus Omnitrophica bacterium]|nr:TylF/MycF family methyltransferase [Candidatus Omnitrophota bacterium]
MANGQSVKLYLDLLKKTLTFTLWPEPPLPVEIFSYKYPVPTRIFFKILSALCRVGKMRLVKDRRFASGEREQGRVWPGYADTMIGLARLDNIQECAETVIKENVPGDLIETGVWRGGACIFMRAVLAAYGIVGRKVYVCDSFEGLPKPDEEKYPADKGDTHHVHQFIAVSQEEVEHNFRKYGLLDEQVVFLKGWFKDTLPAAPIEKIALMRLDGDMYSSTIDALQNLYPKLSPGGFCIIDDYALKGCKQAVDDYRRDHGIAAPIRTVDWTGVYWRKE